MSGAPLPRPSTSPRSPRGRFERSRVAVRARAVSRPVPGSFLWRRAPPPASSAGCGPRISGREKIARATWGAIGGSEPARVAPSTLPARRGQLREEGRPGGGSAGSSCRDRRASSPCLRRSQATGSPAATGSPELVAPPQPVGQPQPHSTWSPSLGRRSGHRSASRALFNPRPGAAQPSLTVADLNGVFSSSSPAGPWQTETTNAMNDQRSEVTAGSTGGVSMLARRLQIRGESLQWSQVALGALAKHHAASVVASLSEAMRDITVARDMHNAHAVWAETARLRSAPGGGASCCGRSTWRRIGAEPML